MVDSAPNYSEPLKNADAVVYAAPMEPINVAI